MTVEVLEIEAAGPLDQIVVFWCNYGPGAGSVTITCWGAAWTAYFPGMGGLTIQEFVKLCDGDYLVGKLASTFHLEQTKQECVYLNRIVARIQEKLTNA
jgi:hypothetical protein